MPYENEHACRISNPDKFEKLRRKNCEQKKDDKCIDVIYGIRDDDKTEIQSLRLPTKDWSEKSAKKLCKSRKGTFEPAANSKSDNQKPEKRFVSMPTASIEIRKDDDDNKFITGYGAVFYNRNDEGTEFNLFGSIKERIEPGAFTRAIKDGDVRGLFNHDPNYLLARTSSGTMKLTEDKKGLRYDIKIDEFDADHQKILAKIQRGDLSGSSFSFVVTKEEWENEGDDDKDTIRRIKEVNLYDVGPVTFPAYSSTTSGVREEDIATEVRSKFEELQDKEQKERRKQIENDKKQKRARQIEIEANSLATNRRR